MSNHITITCPSCSRAIKVPWLHPDITPETYTQVHRYAQRADGGRSMNESEEALLSDLERVTAGRAELRALLHAEMAAHQTTAGERDDARAERDALHDRIEGALAEVLGNPVMSIHDGDGPAAPDLESLIKLAGQIRQERDELRLTLGHVAVLEVSPPTPDQPLSIRVERVQQLDGAVLWAVRQGGSVLARDGRWEHEPLPSSRTAAFLTRCRFPTLGDAWSAATGAADKAQG